MTINLLAGLCFGYAAFLFVIAYYADRLSAKGKQKWLRNPWVYTLSLSVYCTAWTFYGAVGSAARSGMEFLAIYIGPSLAFFAWWLLLRKMVVIGKAQNITSIADFISTRFGKSQGLAAIVTLICCIAIVPYISLQLQSVTASFNVFFPEQFKGGDFSIVAFISSIGLALFVILFGTRNSNISERQSGVVTAIAFESAIKLIAILLVGFVAISHIGSPKQVFELPEAEALMSLPIYSARWLGLISVSFMAVLVLPRMFHVLVVENEVETQLFTASWAFPLYLFLLNICVLPIAIVGLNMFGDAQNPDYFLITIPLALGHDWVALMAFIGGFSAATSMVIMSTIAVSVMVTNHIVVPIWLDARGRSSDRADLRRGLVNTRRLSIIVIVLMGYSYFEVQSEGAALASIGLIAFTGVAQIFPSLIASLFWRGATKTGAYAGLITGMAIWLYTFYFPSLSGLLGIAQGNFGLSFLASNTSFANYLQDPFLNALFWSLLLNVIALISVSLMTAPRSLEIMFGNRYVGALNQVSARSILQSQSETQIEEFFVLAERVLGEQRARNFFEMQSKSQSRNDDLPIVTDQFLEALELSFSGVVGGAAAHALISQLAGARAVPLAETVKLADETMQTIETSRVLKSQSEEIERTARALREANAVLVELDSQKDGFLSQVSHELRTPLTSLRALTEILHDNPDLPSEERARMLSIMTSENERLTHLLDDILDLSYLAQGQAQMSFSNHNIWKVIQHSVSATEGLWSDAGMEIVMPVQRPGVIVTCDLNRISQVFINLINNAVKYVDAVHPKLEITVRDLGKMIEIDFTDNGKGVPANKRKKIFEKFARGDADELAGSAGLGLAISQEIMNNHLGDVKLMNTLGGAKFRVTLPKEHSQ